MIEFGPAECRRLLGLVPYHRALGQVAEWDAALKELIRKHGRARAYEIAAVVAFRNEADRAFEWLAKAVDFGDLGMAFISIDSRFANAHNDSRWLPFLESIGMPQTTSRNRIQRDTAQVVATVLRGWGIASTHFAPTF